MNKLRFTKLLVILLFSILLHSCKSEEKVHSGKFEPDEFESIDSKQLIQINGMNQTAPIVFYKLSAMDFSQNYFFIADEVEFKVVKLNKEYSTISKVGRKGLGPQEFRFGPKELSYNAIKQKLYVLDGISPIIKVFDSDLNYIKKITAPTIIKEFDINSKGCLGIAIASAIGMDLIYIYDENEKKITNSFHLKNLLNDDLWDMFSFKFLENDDIAIVFNFKNKIQIYSENGDLKHEFSIPFLPKESRSTYSKRMEKLLPIKPIFLDFTIDNLDNLLILVSDYVKPFNQTIIKVDKAGANFERLLLAEPAFKVEYNKYKKKLFTIKKTRDDILEYEY